MAEDMSSHDILLRAYDAYADAIYRHCYFRVFKKARAEVLGISVDDLVATTSQSSLGNW